MVKGIIFDKDGVLFDTEPYCARAYIEVLRRYGASLTEEEYYQHWTRNGKGLSEFLEEKNLEKDITLLRKEISDLLIPSLVANPPIIDGVTDVLNRLH